MKVPRLFVGGRYIGSEPEIQRLHESGELAAILHDAVAVVPASSDGDDPTQQPSASAPDRLHDTSIPAINAGADDTTDGPSSIGLI